MQMLEAFETFQDTLRRVHTARRNHLGYPYNLTARSLVPAAFHNWLINNLGDPYAGSHFASEVCGLERNVVAWLQRLWECDDGDHYWGSVGASGTEGNLWALYLAREALPEATLVYSKDAHYSIPKSARILRMPTLAVDSHLDGSIDIAALRVALDALGSTTVILALTCGTTFKGAHDNISGAMGALDDAGFQAGKRFVHVDGALNAMVLPFIGGAPDSIRPTFRLGIDSLSTSGHKMIGTPMPCGVLVARQRHVIRISTAIGYLRSNDTTLMGSRNGHAVLSLWAHLIGHGHDGYAADVRLCLNKARALAERLAGFDVPILLNPLSLTVVFPEPSQEIVRQYQLATHDGKAHAILMPSVADELIEQFCCDYAAWWEASRQPTTQLRLVG